MPNERTAWSLSGSCDLRDFEEVRRDVLKVKPEPKAEKSTEKPTGRKAIEGELAAHRRAADAAGTEWKAAVCEKITEDRKAGRARHFVLDFSNHFDYMAFSTVRWSSEGFAGTPEGVLADGKKCGIDL